MISRSVTSRRRRGRRGRPSASRRRTSWSSRTASSPTGSSSAPICRRARRGSHVICHYVSLVDDDDTDLPSGETRISWLACDHVAGDPLAPQPKLERATGVPSGWTTMSADVSASDVVVFVTPIAMWYLNVVVRHEASWLSCCVIVIVALRVVARHDGVRTGRTIVTRRLRTGSRCRRRTGRTTRPAPPRRGTYR